MAPSICFGGTCRSRGDRPSQTAVNCRYNNDARARVHVPLRGQAPSGLFESLAEIMRHDKKQRGGKISFALPCAPGDVRLVPEAV